LMFVLIGVPTAHDIVFLWLGLGMAAFSLEPSRMVRDWLPLVGVLLVYDLLRGFADGAGFAVHEIPQIRVEAGLFGRPIPTVWLQEHLWHGGNHLAWWDYLTWGLHLSHFLFTFLALAALWIWRRDDFTRYATMVWVLALAGFATYVLYPAVPPWLAARDGNVGRSNRIIDVIWHHVPIPHAGAVFEHGRGYANNIAAMPSLHAAYAVLLSLVLWRVLPRVLKPLLVIYPFAMTFALVYAGEHYVVDCIAGAVYAYAVFRIVDAVLDARAARQETLAAEPVPID
jgi:membrane-associated phospholipid phosphatase